ncbi:MAG: cytidylate kinase family protein, partial [Kiritimatiellaeota bacterium]|nr:cytidylate kinase family protein [Kiritimatiellota bacterium]
MNAMERVKKYLRDRMGLAPEPTGYPFVTISRQAGAGGHTLARAIIRELPRATEAEWGRGWEVFDYRLCLLVAQDPDLKLSLESLLTEGYERGLQQTIRDMLTGQSEQYYVQKRIFEVIRILAAMGRVVIVGRAGNYIARRWPHGLHVRLVAPAAQRLKCMQELMDASEEDARCAMLKQDHERAALVRDF